MSDWEVILEVGAEGGSVTLYGIQTQPSFFSAAAPRSGLHVAKAAELRKVDPKLTEQGWFFKMNSTESIDEELHSQFDSPVVDSWEAAIGLFDRYSWQRLYPLIVHPAFSERIWSAVRDRLAKDYASGGQLDRWRTICEANLL
jgi:hypothetical protein